MLLENSWGFNILKNKVGKSLILGMWSCSQGCEGPGEQEKWDNANQEADKESHTLWLDTEAKEVWKKLFRISVSKPETPKQLF